MKAREHQPSVVLGIGGPIVCHAFSEACETDPVKRTRAHGGCLGTDRRRRARQAAIILGEPHVGIDPGVPEWGNPARVMSRHPLLNP